MKYLLILCYSCIITFSLFSIEDNSSNFYFEINNKLSLYFDNSQTSKDYLYNIIQIQDNKDEVIYQNYYFDSYFLNYNKITDYVFMHTINNQDYIFITEPGASHEEQIFFSLLNNRISFIDKIYGIYTIINDYVVMKDIVSGIPYSMLHPQYRTYKISIDQINQINMPDDVISVLENNLENLGIKYYSDFKFYYKFALYYLNQKEIVNYKWIDKYFPKEKEKYKSYKEYLNTFPKNKTLTISSMTPNETTKYYYYKFLDDNSE